MIVIVDYGIGNLGSIANMLKRIGVRGIVSSDATIIREADKLILPGVGTFDNGMRNLTERGLLPILNELVLENRVPILGLCLGMQLFCQSSEEGQLPGLGWLNAQTVRFRLDSYDHILKTPHMGWNYVKFIHARPLFGRSQEALRFYFAHSYHVTCEDPKDVVATSRYGYDFPSMVARGNILGVQFHPEKSHKFGTELFKYFAESL